MYNISAPQKQLFEMAQTLTNTMEKMTQASLQMANTMANTANATAAAVSKACFDGISTCCNLAETTAQQTGKTGTTTGK